MKQWFLRLTLTVCAGLQAHACKRAKLFVSTTGTSTCRESQVALQQEGNPLAIVGGAFAGNSTAQEKATAGLLVLHTLANGDVKAGHCTGVVANEQTLLTAAHCVTPDASAVNVSVYATFASTLSDPYPSRASEIIIHPFYDPSGNSSNYDIAVIKLRSPVPSGQVIPSFIETNEPLTAGRPVTAIGYGVTGTNDDNSGTKRRATSFVNEVIDEVSFPNSPLLFQVRVTDNEGARSGACFGDSGGPGFLENSATVFGLVQGTHGSIQSNPLSCEAGDYNYTLVGPYIPWIEEVLGAQLNKETAITIIQAREQGVSTVSNTAQRDVNTDSNTDQQSGCVK